MTQSSTWSKANSRTTTESTSTTRGRTQTLKPVLQVMPTQGYTLEELIFEAAAQIAGGLEQGECIAKIGGRPAVKVNTLRVKDGWARQEHIERVKVRLAAQTPFILSTTTLIADRREVPLIRASSGSATMPALPTGPKDVDEGWG